MTPIRCGFPACTAALVSLVAVGCVFTPPPPLPEELAAQNAEQAARAASVQSGEAYDPDAEDPRFAPGVEPELGMSSEEMKAYAAAQGDPAGGDFGLEEALAGVDPGRELWARLEMSGGTLECRLLPEYAPRTVANFVGLARGVRPSRDPDTGQWEGRPYYDGTEFHRVIEGFMIQGGDPTGTGRGNAGYVIPDEFAPALRHDGPGMLSMANRGPGTGSAQFFITLGPTPHLDDKHTIFGHCTDDDSIALAEAIAATRGPGDRPMEPQVIERVVIESR
jgi:peptidyl-prolyl cis-trans isomerase A (cyclophilin A)